VLPGMRVDVLVTGRPLNRADTETQTVLQNITVLSAGQTTQTDGKGQPIVATVVTLLVSLQEAEALTLANSEGKIQLVLRNSTDRAVVATGGRKLHELYGAAPAPPAGPAPPPRAHASPAPRPIPVAAPPPETLSAPKPDQMILMSGGARKVVVFAPEPEGQ
jgi:pilus assembly protein CpaB